MVGKDGELCRLSGQHRHPGGKAKPLKKPKGKEQHLTDEDMQFKQKQKEEQAAAKAYAAGLKGKKK
eukprot:CAMPEP_0175973438 /NCGR_PEP_ID=MMETSP0108-20121206/42798_1 /TAXON_ID=195067 ORGANISM="Goniomonas pacifica, Strain CCMP1869" /NCGR_SAMPLE_ID=MMETSP0108 /ASSEMBLY_ACC=CAM_ASM_000204 /LENGTH=65 /DNA_ID=CAMNT_0017302893 /DNA_START=6 /DNA_END=203 /DNA_ORIENTATION=-